MSKFTPNKDLPHNFTARTLTLALRAKKRTQKRALLQTWFKRLAPAALAIAVIGTSSAGVYATANWFNGEVEVVNNQDKNTISVDLSACQSTMPPGFDPDTTSKGNLAFKTLRPDHVDPDALKQLLLIGCELSATLTMLQNTEVLQNKDLTNFASAEIVKINGESMTLALNLGPTPMYKDVVVASPTPVFILNDHSDASFLKVGDYVVIAYNFMDGQPAREDQDHSQRPVEVIAVAKTSYDTRLAPQNSKAFYDEHGIMPLPMWENLQK